MTIASGTAYNSELRTLWEEVIKLGIMLEPYAQGNATVGVYGRKQGRWTEAQVDAQIAAVSAAITAVNS